MNIDRCQYTYAKQVAYFNLRNGKWIVGRLMTSNRYGSVYLSSFQVDAKHRNKGWGTKIILEAIAFWKKRGIHKFTLCVDSQNTKAQKLYERLGFVYVPHSDGLQHSYRSMELNTYRKPLKKAA